MAPTFYRGEGWESKKRVDPLALNPPSQAVGNTLVIWLCARIRLSD